MDDATFVSWLADQLADLPSVVAVALGGSRARRTHDAGSDWDFAIYYRGAFDPDTLRAKGWDGEVFDVGGWGGGVMNGGAWLHVGDRRVDVHYRDLDDVEHWCDEARAGRFRKEFLSFYVAGIPTYVVMAELALDVVLAGELPRPEYPDALSREAARRWQDDAIATLAYAEAASRERGDVTVALANGARGIVEASHSRLAARKEWVLNEKGMARAAGLDGAAEHLLRAASPAELTDAIRHVGDAVAD
jgi:predicted nucleotidyltransferase